MMWNTFKCILDWHQNVFFTLETDEVKTSQDNFGAILNLRLLIILNNKDTNIEVALTF